MCKSMAVIFFGVLALVRVAVLHAAGIAATAGESASAGESAAEESASGESSAGRRHDPVVTVSVTTDAVSASGFFA